MKTEVELWDMVKEFDQLREQEQTSENMARQLSITEHLAEWLAAHRGAAESIDDYHLGQSAAMCVAMAPSRTAARSIKE